ncbi:Uncharacterised protein [Atlantibacter hermannii]|nr:Uncharacterised protein [Atlantibacter hermannii]
MTKITAAGMALVIPFGTAMAADISAGVEGEAQFTPYKSYKTDYSAIPYLGYDNKIVYLDGTEAGVYFVNDDKTNLKRGSGIWMWNSIRIMRGNGRCVSWIPGTAP